MKIDEIRERLLAGAMTPERFAKAKALALRSRRHAAAAFLDLLQALPEVSEQMIVQAHTFRVQQLTETLVAIKARQADTPEARAEQARMVEALEFAGGQEYASHAAWRVRQDASKKQGATTSFPSSGTRGDIPDGPEAPVLDDTRPIE